MSAIVGIFHMNNEPVTNEHSMNIMAALQKYPADDVQVWRKDNIFLGCHAQWITPESINEPLPYYDSLRQLAITADAIIDNRDELFELLNIERDRRQGMKDSQLILQAYVKWGEDAPKFLVGDFAFMIWDERKQLLFGARDFTGTRTLYYFHDRYRFTFCTTIEPILSLPYVKKQLNELWLAEYLAILGTIDTVDATTTPYHNINLLPPSHSISIMANKINIKRYVSISFGSQLKLKSDGEYVEAFKDVFQKAVTSKLRTHKKVGSYLSGGLDSSSVVSFAAKNSLMKNKELHTFSYVPTHDFVDFTPRYLTADERPFIKSTVDYVGGIKDHYLDFQGKSPFTEIDDYIDALEMPYKFFENSFWIKGIYEKAHKHEIGVLLDGGAGNFTISWGSAFDYYSILLKKLQWIRLFKELDSYSRYVGGPRLRMLPDVLRAGFPILNKVFPLGKPFKLPTLINSKFAQRTGVYEKLREHGFSESGWFPRSTIYKERRRIYENIFLWNASHIRASKMSLRHSLWERDPTNDLRVYRFCFSVPEGQYVRNGVDRSLIRRSTVNYLPDKVRLNHSVKGIQSADWVHRMKPHWDTFLEESEMLASDKKFLEYVDGQVIRSALLKVKNGPIPERCSDADYKTLMRSLILYRFLKKFA
ncbi:lasso peptide isopeptide bond-forming cyclase [Paenibacillus cremeus]|uniref:asparagine synthase (glutamine-hydrolyzing) n=1 Tax=Paenibacillus cremeus TaxID=2163881 RepID=A0A559K0E7_9BACL|nr:lasso peptide isopeptide bond-forming cyclase [Paenibacillus cremeus]TVY05624.1 lasso peptide isopeptide bond-forming cyclase [Paenibacillus cremeus]